MSVEFIFKGQDIYGNETITGYALTEDNFDALMGANIGARMRFGRMPKDQFEMVRHYIKQKAKAFIDYVPEDKRKEFEPLIRKFFGV